MCLFNHSTLQSIYCSSRFLEEKSETWQGLGTRVPNQTNKFMFGSFRIQSGFASHWPMLPLAWTAWGWKVAVWGWGRGVMWHSACPHPMCPQPAHCPFPLSGEGAQTQWSVPGRHTSWSPAGSEGEQTCWEQSRSK